MSIFAVKRSKVAMSVINRTRPQGSAPCSPANRTQQDQIRRIIRSTGAQAKLTIGQPNDKYEQEADRVADRVVHMSDADVAQRVENRTVQPMQIQRICSGDGETLVRRNPTEDDELSLDDRMKSEGLSDDLLPKSDAPEFQEAIDGKEELPEEIDGNIQTKELQGQNPQIENGTESRINSLKAGGQPLDPATRSFFEPRFGHDFSNVRIHSDHNAADTAASIHARAFTLGNHVVMGAGEYQPENQTGKKLLGHELTHVVQQGKTGQDKVQRDVVKEMQDLLSYGVFDWVITDAEAAKVLYKLSKISERELPSILTRLGSKYVTRLLDNLPDNLKTGPTHKKIVQMLGVSGLTGYTNELLTYKLFDWAVTGSDVKNTYNIYSKLEATKQEDFLFDLESRGLLGRLISNSNSGQHTAYLIPWINGLTTAALTDRQKEILFTIVKKSGNHALETLKLATIKRFGVSLAVKKKADKWQPELLKKVYTVLSGLPDAHVSDNTMLGILEQYTHAPTTGSANNNIRAGQYNYITKKLSLNTYTRPVKPTATQDAPAHQTQEDTIRHEIGHAVDYKLGWSTGSEPANPKRGGWKNYKKNYKTCADEMLNDSRGAINALDSAQRTDVIAVMDSLMSAKNVDKDKMEANLNRVIASKQWFTNKPASDRRVILKDKALKALRIGLTAPWRTDRGGEPLGKYIYQASYFNNWVRYEHQARARKVSKYQFKYPQEWFAEAYKFYYAPDGRGRGAKLNDKDSNTKTYFDDYVHHPSYGDFNLPSQRDQRRA